ncbi:hypothetical protein KBB96_07595 [Luteolibacter ambystomatis]|uniref:Uncharacterized protein n=1 Tax=Luteolibacter ambystomatis TaxID=2824561 RepID=A0A975J2B9_9BACT|nr:hypothetical protein [Luteolibacter ambystomatis]QUE52747.1 hypothetical protein KBB96_07595 [Luteolibacter ambystomatis]
MNTQDNYYWYDGLQQVTRHDRGNLVPSFGPPYTGVDNRQQQELFNFDETGNWNSNYSESPALDQSRVNNQANQIVSLDGPASVVQPAYDLAGNMTTIPKPGDWILLTYTCDLKRSISGDPPQSIRSMSTKVDRCVDECPNTDDEFPKSFTRTLAFTTLPYSPGATQVGPRVDVPGTPGGRAWV